MQAVSLTFFSHVIVCENGVLIGFFGIMMTFGLNIRWKFRSLNNNFKINKKVANLKDELCGAIYLNCQVKELSIITQFGIYFRGLLKFYLFILHIIFIQ